MTSLVEHCKGGRVFSSHEFLNHTHASVAHLCKDIVKKSLFMFADIMRMTLNLKMRTFVWIWGSVNRDPLTPSTDADL